MVLFKIYYVSQSNNWTDKEEKFFSEVQSAAYNAFFSQKRNMTTDEWNVNGFLYLSKEEVKTVFQKDVLTPSVIVLYRGNANGQFKAAYLKGVGAPKAWQAAFQKIFDGVATETPEKGNGGDKDQAGKDKGYDDGNGGTGNDNGFPLRPCIPFIDTPINALLEMMGLDAETIATYKKYILLGGAGLCTFGAFNSSKRVGQVGYGAAAAALAALALMPIDPAKPC
jgi:hypothetical protein